MKFLLAFAFLITTSAYSQRVKPTIKCYEPAQQGGSSTLAYVLESKSSDRGPVLHVKEPADLKGPLKLDEEGCLSHPGNSGVDMTTKDRLTLCPTDGQVIRNLVPVDTYINGEDYGTVYCEKKIEKWFDPVTMY